MTPRSPGLVRLRGQGERVTVHHLTYARVAGDDVNSAYDDDLITICIGCLNELGIDVDEDEEPVVWDEAMYPYAADASRGDPLYRPDATWPPSINEVLHRRPELAWNPDEQHLHQ